MGLPSYFAFLLLAVVAWGTFTFGAVYDWAAVPLFCACTLAGMLGLMAPGGGDRASVSWPLRLALGLVIAAVLVQLVPLDAETLAALSPATDRFLREYDLVYAAGGGGHPLSINPGATRWGVAALAGFALLLAGAARGLGSRSLRTLTFGLIAIGFVLALAGIVQSGLSGSGRPFTRNIYGLVVLENRNPFGPFINRNHFAGWMLMVLPLALGCFTGLVARGMRGVGPTLRERVLWFSSPEASRVILVGLAILVMGMSLVLTLSRSGIGCFVVALAISAFFVVRRQSGGSRRTVLLSYVAVLLVLSVAWAGLDAILARFAQLPGTGLNGRLGVWGDAWRVVSDFRWTGTGLNTFGDAMLLYQTFDMTTHTAEAHNDYLQLLADGGLLVAVPAFLAILALAREIRRRFRQRSDDVMSYWLRVGATTGLVAIGLQETVEFSLRLPGHAALLAVVAGVALHRGPRQA